MPRLLKQAANFDYKHNPYGEADQWKYNVSIKTVQSAWLQFKCRLFIDRLYGVYTGTSLQFQDLLVLLNYGALNNHHHFNRWDVP